MTTGLMTSDERIIVKRRYLKPIPPEDRELEKMNMRTSKYKTSMRSKMCTTCSNFVTQMLCCDVDGATFIERYCDTCIKENKHIKESELMENFDNLFVRREPES